MSSRLERPSVDAALGNHEVRIREIEARTTGPWIYIGDPGAPAFQNSWVNVGGGLTPLRFRWIYDRGIEIQGSITGGMIGTVIFTLPSDYAPDFELRGVVVDDNGALLALKIKANGDVLGGISSTPIIGGSGIFFDTNNVGGWLQIETPDFGAAVTTGFSTYSFLGIGIVDSSGGGMVIGTSNSGDFFLDSGHDLMLDAVRNVAMNGVDMVGSFSASVEFDTGPSPKGFFVNGGQALFTLDGGFEADATTGVFLNNSGANGIQITETAAALASHDIVISSDHNRVQVMMNGILVFEIRNDGTVHILTGGVIHADL